MADVPRISVVIVAYGAEDWLERSVEACLASDGASVDVVLVDNGCTDGAVDRLDGRDGVTIVRPGRNLGFAAGCNRGVETSTAPVVALVNPDAVVEPDALAALADRLADPGIGIATGCVVLADRPDLLNSAGNEIHFTGMSWSGHFEEAVADHGDERDVFAASGALCAVRREVWDHLGGFDETFFAYYEDAQLSVRCWQQGWRVVYVPVARVSHRYEFSRRPQKMELLERNRWQLVLTCYGGRLLAATLPVLLTFEVAVVAMAAVQGWLPQKLRSWGWLVRHAADLRARRRAAQLARTVLDRSLVGLFAEDLAPANVDQPAGLATVSGAYRAWWRLVRRAV